MSKSRVVYSTDQGRHCPTCSQPVNACRCSNQSISNITDGVVWLQRQVKGRAGKPVVIISGLGLDPSELKKLAKKLKSKCGAGGSIENNDILIQGDNRDLVKSELESLGFIVKLAGG